MNTLQALIYVSYCIKTHLYGSITALKLSMQARIHHKMAALWVWPSVKETECKWAVTFVYTLCMYFLISTQVLLCGRSSHFYPHRWNNRWTLSWRSLLPGGNCSTSALWSRDLCGCYTRNPLWALWAWLALCVWCSVLVSCRLAVL